MKYKTTVGDQEFDIEINREDEVIVNGRRVPVDFHWLEGRAIFSLLIEHDSHEALVEEHGDTYSVLLQGRMFDVHVEDERRLARTSREFAVPSGEILFRAPMPGLMVTVPVTVGQAIQKGDVLAVLESMKMENELRAPRDGVVSAVRVRPGQSVMQDQVLLILS
jgi:biotin carboxyl carrier protein